MGKYVARLSILRGVVGFLNFFTLGAVIGWCLTEDTIYIVAITIYVICNLAAAVLLWKAALKNPPVLEYEDDCTALLKLHIPTMIYAALLLILLAAELAMPYFTRGVEDPFQAQWYGGTLVSAKYFMQSLMPLGINTVMVEAVAEDIQINFYYPASFLNLLIYAVTITVIYKKNLSKARG